MYISHYSYSKRNCLKRITDNNEMDIPIIAAQLCQLTGTAYERFKVIHDYYPKRLETERWLYEEAKKIGIYPSYKSPWYFVLGDSSILKSGFGVNSYQYKIDLNLINRTDISFTIGDSIGVYYLPTVYKVLYAKEEIINMINNHILDLPYEYQLLQPKHRYIEAQLWTDKYFI